MEQNFRHGSESLLQKVNKNEGNLLNGNARMFISSAIIIMSALFVVGNTFFSVEQFLVVGLLFGFILIINPKIMTSQKMLLFCFIISFPFNSENIINISDFFLVLLGFFAFLKNKGGFNYRLPFLIISIFFATMLLSAFWSVSLTSSAYSIIYWLKIIILILVVPKVIKNKNDLRQAIFILAVVILVQSTLALAQYGAQVYNIIPLFAEKNISKIPLLESQVYRAGGLLNAGVLAEFLLAGIPIAIYGVISIKRRKFKLAFLLALVIFALTIFITGSRGAVIALFISIPLLAIIESKYFQISRFKTLAFAAILLLIVFTLSPRLTQEVNDPYGESRTVRNDIAISVIKDNPFGVGIGNYIKRLTDYVQDDKLQVSRVHNTYLLITSEIGVFGLILFLLFVTSIFFPKIKKDRSEDILEIKALQYLILIIIFSICIHELYSMALFAILPISELFFLLCGFALSIRELANSNYTKVSNIDLYNGRI